MSQPTNIAAIILAAGASTRLGRPKQLLVFNGETLVERAIRIATEAGLSPTIAVVLNIPELLDRLQSVLPHPRPSVPISTFVCVHRTAADGISKSIRSGIRQAHAEHATGAVLLTCDQIAVTPTHLQALCAQPEAPCGSSYSGRIGIPAYFPSSSFDALLALEGDTGARDLLRQARSIPAEFLAFDIDTEADVQTAKTLLNQSAR